MRLAGQQRALRERRRADAAGDARQLGAVTFGDGADAARATARRHRGRATSVSTVHHVPVERGRAAHRLARVVDDEVEPAARGVEVAAERLDARRVAQVEAEDLEPVAPVVEVGLARVPQRGVAREAGGDDERRARRAGA